MEWMDIKKVEKIILEMRKQEFNDIENEDVIYNCQIALIKIKELKDFCLNSSIVSEQNILTNILLFLKIEAEIINIMGIAIYGDFTNGRNLTSYLEIESKYAYKEYIEDIGYFAKNYQEIGILPLFYIKQVEEQNI